MPNRSIFYAAIAIAVGILVWLVVVFYRIGGDPPALAERQLKPINEAMKEEMPAANPAISDEDLQQFANDLGGEFADVLLNSLLKDFLSNKGAIRNQATLRFASDEALRNFLAGKFGSGFRILDTLEGLRSVKIGFDSAQDLWDALAQSGLQSGDVDIGANYVVSYPRVPNPSDPASDIAPQPDAVGFGYGLFEWLGIAKLDISQWGRGVKIAVIDGMIQSHSTFRDGQVRVFDLLGTEISADDGHATAVAGLIAGNDKGAPGIVPGAEIYGYRVLDSNGYGDSFTLASAITQAVDAGIKIINISLGSYGDSIVVSDAVAYAAKNGSLIIAAAGNDGANSITFPAGYASVISVGSVEAKGEHMNFSNSGSNLDIAAPGYVIPAAWPGEQLVEFSGTSASAPVTTASIVALMSVYPNLSPTQAYNLLASYANEAGAPGVDPQHGAGNVNLARPIAGTKPGVIDVGVASNYYNPASTQSGQLPTLQITVENRGTDPVYNVQVGMTGDNQKQSFTVNFLAPGGTYTQNVPLNTNDVASDGYIHINTAVDLTSGTSDQRYYDNRLQSLITPPTVK
jgi:hypothetical protein